MCPKGVASRPAKLSNTNSPRLVPLLCVSALPSSTEFAVNRGQTLQHGCRARSESIATQVFMVAFFLPGPKPSSTPSTRITVPALHLHGQPVEVGKMREGRFFGPPRARLRLHPSPADYLRTRGGSPLKVRPMGYPVFRGQSCAREVPPFIGCAPKTRLRHRSPWTRIFEAPNT